MRVATIDIERPNGSERRRTRFLLQARPGVPTITLRGTLHHALGQAVAMTRRDEFSWAVLQASNGVYQLVPLWVGRQSRLPEVDEIARDLHGVKGVERVGLSRLASNAVAIAGTNGIHRFDERGAVSLPA